MLEDIKNVQRYLIGGFVEFGYAQDYRGILPPEIFGIYAPLFVHMSQHGSAKTPEYFEAMKKCGIKEVAEAIKSADVSFIQSRGKYVTKLFDFHVADAMSRKFTPMEILEKVRDTYVKLEYLDKEAQGGISTMESLLGKLHEDICEEHEYGEKGQFYRTGISFLDKYTGGLKKGRTIRLSAYSNTGKSALSYFVANNVLRQGAKVLYFSLEISKDDLRDRMVSNYYGIPIGKFEHKASLVGLDLTEYAGLKLYVSNESFTMSEIEKLTASVKPDVVVIDYVQLVRGEGNSEYEQMNDVARRIRKLTAEHNVAVFDLSQVSNDGKEYRSGGVISTKGSGELVSAASTVLVMTESKNPGRLNLHIAKNRHGQKGKCVELKPDFSVSHFEEVQEWDPNEKSF